MNLLLRPLEDINDPVWSVIISIMLLLCGVGYYIYTIMSLAYEELNETQEDTTVSDHCPDSNVVDNHIGDTDIIEQ